MRILLELCGYLYGLSLRLYPSALCNQFGADMREVFRRQTADAWAVDGWSGLLAVLWCAAQEFFTEAICFRAASPALIAGASSLLCTSATFVCLLWALSNPLAVKVAGHRLQQLVWDGGRTPHVGQAGSP